MVSGSFMTVLWCHRYAISKWAEDRKKYMSGPVYNIVQISTIKMAWTKIYFIIRASTVNCRPYTATKKTRYWNFNCPRSPTCLALCSSFSYLNKRKYIFGSAKKAFLWNEYFEKILIWHNPFWFFCMEKNNEKNC